MFKGVSGAFGIQFLFSGVHSHPVSTCTKPTDFIQAPPLLSAAEYEELREATRTFAQVGAYAIDAANLSTPERALRVRAARVDEHALAALGLQPEQGRFFAARETDAPDGEPAPANEPDPMDESPKG